MAENRKEPFGFDITSLRLEGSSVGIGNSVLLEFEEIERGKHKSNVKVKLTEIEAVDVMRSIALFLGYDFVKKEGV